jgi:hypothetical protein
VVKLSKVQIKAFSVLTDAQLRATFESLGKRPGDLVKATGVVKLKVAQYGDLILAELKRRQTA